MLRPVYNLRMTNNGTNVHRRRAPSKEPEKEETGTSPGIRVSSVEKPVTGRMNVDRRKEKEAKEKAARVRKERTAKEVTRRSAITRPSPRHRIEGKAVAMMTPFALQRRQCCM